MSVLQRREILKSVFKCDTGDISFILVIDVPTSKLTHFQNYFDEDRSYLYDPIGSHYYNIMW